MIFGLLFKKKKFIKFSDIVFNSCLFLVLIRLMYSLPIYVVNLPVIFKVTADIVFLIFISLLFIIKKFNIDILRNNELSF